MSHSDESVRQVVELLFQVIRCLLVVTNGSAVVPEASTYVLDQIETKRNTLSKAEEIRGKREIENLKANHATSEQIAEAQLKTANKLREIEKSAARQRQMAAMDEFDSLKRVIAAKEEELNTWSGSLAKYKEAKKELDDLKGRYQELFRTIENEGAAIANLALETAIAC